MANPYLENLRSRYSALQTSVSELQTRASAEKRDLSDDELRTVKSQIEAGQKAFAEIELLTEQENRTASVNEMAAKLAVRTEEVRSISISATPRDPGHYRKASDGGQNSFFADMYRSQKMGDGASARRLQENSDALRAHQTYATEPGVIPPVWLSDEYTTIKQQGRVVSSVVRNVPLADARPFSLPGQTASTTTGTQGGENVALTAGDAYASAAVSITPTTIVGSEIISRQLLESSTPAIDQLILADLVESYNTQVEGLVTTAIKGVGSLLTGAVIAGTAFAAPTNAQSAYVTAVQLQAAVYKARFLRPDYIAMDHDLFAVILGMVDTTGRPLLSNPLATAQGQNVTGNGGIGGSVTDGWLAGVPILVSEGMFIDGTHNGIAAMRSQDVILFEKAGPSLFRFEEVQGPQSIVLSLWNYAAVAVRQGTRSVKNASITNNT